MQTTIILTKDCQQVNFIPENEQEELALQMFKPTSEINVAVVEGHFGEDRFKPFTIDVKKCAGGYLRAYDDEKGTMFVITEKKEIPSKDINYEDIKTSVIDKMVSHVGTLVDENYHMGYVEGIQNFINALEKLSL